MTRLLAWVTVMSLSLALMVTFGDEKLMDWFIGLVLLIVLIYGITVFFLTQDDDL
jgi:small-conductance mechanosensitive channel